jgi:hypothetical protein
MLRPARENRRLGTVHLIHAGWLRRAGFMGADVTIVFEKAGYLVVSHNAAKDYILFDWTNFNVSLDEIKVAHEKALEVAKRHNCRHYVADTSKVTNALRQDIISWWGSTWVPTLAKFGLRTVATVLPKSAVANMSTNSWQRQVVDGIEMINVGSRAEAESALTRV